MAGSVWYNPTSFRGGGARVGEKEVALKKS